MRDVTMVRIVGAPFLWKTSNFWRVKLTLKIKLLKVYLHQNQCCITNIFFPHNSEQIKNCNKNFNQKTDNSTEILQEHVDKASNDYDVEKWLKKKNDSVKQLNFDEDLPTRNMLWALAPKQNEIKICDVMNESVSCFSNRTKLIIQLMYCK